RSSRGSNYRAVAARLASARQRDPLLNDASAQIGIHLGPCQRGLWRPLGPDRGSFPFEQNAQTGSIWRFSGWRIRVPHTFTSTETSNRFQACEAEFTLPNSLPTASKNGSKRVAMSHVRCAPTASPGVRIST